MKSLPSSSKVKLLTYTGFLTAILCILGPIAIPLPFSPVPVSFTNLAIYLILIIAEKKTAFFSCLLYILIGAIGIPVLSGFSGGLGKVAGPTGGYLLGFLFLIIVAGHFIERFPYNKWIHFSGMFLGTFICYLFGTIWLCTQLSLSFAAGLAMGVLPYLPFDICKIVIGIIVGNNVKKRIVKIEL